MSNYYYDNYHVLRKNVKPKVEKPKVDYPKPNFDTDLVIYRTPVGMIAMLQRFSHKHARHEERWGFIYLNKPQYGPCFVAKTPLECLDQARAKNKKLFTCDMKGLAAAILDPDSLL